MSVRIVYEDIAGGPVSESPVYSLTAERDRDLVAVFEALSNATAFIPNGETECLRTADKEQFYILR